MKLKVKLFKSKNKFKWQGYSLLRVAEWPVVKETNLL